MSTANTAVRRSAFERWRTTRIADMEAHLAACLPNLSPHSEAADSVRLHEAMRYSVLGGGKRLRALSVLAFGEVYAVNTAALHRVASAVELVHAYSLVHDDLPAMDDDDVRRGRPACHKAYDEGMAILVGDALQALAFECLAQIPDEPTRTLRLIQQFASAIGAHGMAYGQAMDLAMSAPSHHSQHHNGEGLNRLHRHKTGLLLEFSFMAGPRLAGVPANEATPLYEFAKAFGVAFQMYDDILDVIASSDAMGKPQGSDAANDKLTYVSAYGVAGAKAHYAAMRAQVLDHLAECAKQPAFMPAFVDYFLPPLA